MRDIRNDLQERAAMIGEHIKASQAQFEKGLEQLKRDHDEKVKDLRTELEAINVLLGIEQRRHESAPPVQGQGNRPLSGILMRRAG